MPTSHTAARVFGAALPALNCFVRTSTVGTPIEMIGPAIGAILGPGGALSALFGVQSQQLNVSSASLDSSSVFLLPGIVGPRFVWFGYLSIPDPPPPDPQ